MNTSATTLTLVDAAAFIVGDVIQIDGEQLLVTSVDLTGNTLTVVRGFHHTAAAGHAAGAALFLAADQRGVHRLDTPGEFPDIGAFER